MPRRSTRSIYLSLAVPLLLVLMLTLLAACGEDELGADPPTATPALAATATPTPAPDPTVTPASSTGQIDSFEWILTGIDDSPAHEVTMVTLAFTADGAVGYSGCN